MDKIRYRKLESKDIPRLVELRLIQLEEEGAKPVWDLAPALKEYFEAHLSDGTFVAWLAVAGEQIVGTSGMSFVRKPPYYSNPSGKIGLLSGMYTAKEYRRRRIASSLLSRVVQEAKDYGCGAVWVTASDVGVLLYTDFGFVNNGKLLQYEIR